MYSNAEKTGWPNRFDGVLWQGRRCGRHVTPGNMGSRSWRLCTWCASWGSFMNIKAVLGPRALHYYSSSSIESCIYQSSIQSVPAYSLLALSPLPQWPYPCSSCENSGIGVSAVSVAPPQCVYMSLSSYFVSRVP